MIPFVVASLRDQTSRVSPNMGPVLRPLLARRATHLTLAFSLSLLVAAFGHVTAAAQQYSGQATAVRVSVKPPVLPAVTTAVADTGPLPTAGGNINLASAGTSVAGVVTVGTSTVSASGVAGNSQATASVNNLNASILGNTITATVISANTSCVCPNSILTDNFTITGLVINGTPITASGSANETIALPGGVGSVILNERFFSPRSVTVNAIHISVTAVDLTTTDIIVASARSGISCGQPSIINLYSGRGTGLRLTQGVTLPDAIVSTIVSDTGPLPQPGGSLTTTTVGAGLSPILASGTVTSASSGGVAPSTANSTNSSSNVQNLAVNLLAGTVTINATALDSNSNCAFALGVVTCGGNSTVAGLAVTALGLPVAITVTGAPNETFVIPVGLGSITLIFNEQIPNGTTDITVNALHMTTNLAGLVATDLVVAHAHSDMLGAVAPTAAEASVSGRVTDAGGRAILRALVTATDQHGRVVSASTNSFGNFYLQGLEVGEVYVVRVSARGFDFAPRVLSLSDDVKGFDFVPDGTTP